MTPALRKPAEAHWYLVNTQTGRERLAMDHLERQNYHVFTPWARKTMRHARKLTTVRAALFHLEMIHSCLIIRSVALCEDAALK